MEYVYWFFIIALFIVSFIGLVFPIIPGSLFILGGFLLYGFLFSFEKLSWLFWLVQGLFFLLLLGSDYIANTIGVKKYGGTKAGVYGSTIGLIFGPFVIPVFGILLGPFIGAVLAEIIVNKKAINEAIKIGFGSVIGFISSVVTKGIIQAVMVIYFIIVST